MYIIGILVIAIGFIPLILAKFIFQVLRGTQLSIPLSIYMVLMFSWQMDIGILYFYELLPKNVIMWVFKLFRFAVLYFFPVMIYISYKMYNDVILRDNHNKLLSMIVSKKMFWITFIVSTFLYILNWTPYGISDMHYVELIYKKDLFYLYPISSPTQAYFFITEVLLSIIVSISSFMSISKVQSRTIKRFMAAFFVYSTVLILCGTVNLIPNLGSLVTSIFVIIFSIGLMLSFFRLHLEQNEQFRVLMEREKKMDYIGSLSSSLIHEIRNPLHIIKNFSIVLEKNEKLSENGVEYLKYINSATKQLENIVGNFTDYMKNKKPELEKVDLNEIIDHAIYLTNENTKENRVNVIFEKKYEKLKILANPISSTQVLVNIIKNCAESIPEERQQRLISIDTMYSKGLVYIHIKDTGKGIPQEEWDKIFNPFVSDKEKGMGIGLAFSRKIMYEHSGDLKVLNSTPEGTEFQITIPQHNVW